MMVGMRRWFTGLVPSPPPVTAGCGDTVTARQALRDHGAGLPAVPGETCRVSSVAWDERWVHHAAGVPGETPLIAVAPALPGPLGSGNESAALQQRPLRLPAGGFIVGASA